MKVSELEVCCGVKSSFWWKCFGRRYIEAFELLVRLDIIKEDKAVELIKKKFLDNHLFCVGDGEWQRLKGD